MIRRSLNVSFSILHSASRRSVFALSRSFSKFDNPGNRNDISSLFSIKQEAKVKLKNEKEALDKNLLTVDQITQKIIEIKSLEDLKTKVMGSKKPLVIFCMAKWCHSCKQLLPKVLEEFSAEHEFWDLALLDIDVDPQLTTALQITKVPTVLLVAYGDIIHGFKGMVSESEVQKLFETAKKAGLAYQTGQKTNKLVEELVHEYENQNWDEVLSKVDQLSGIPLQPAMIRLVTLFKVTALLNKNNHAEAETIFNQIQSQPMPQGNEQIIQVIKQIEEKVAETFGSLNQKKEETKVDYVSQLEKTGNEPSALFALANTCMEAEAFDVALEALFRIIKTERNWNEKAAYNKYLDILKNPKTPKPLVKDYRLKLGSLIA